MGMKADHTYQVAGQNISPEINRDIDTKVQSLIYADRVNFTK